jgi:photosystem II stability/assembly factor-like uncharacterized protein
MKTIILFVITSLFSFNTVYSQKTQTNINSYLEFSGNTEFGRVHLLGSSYQGIVIKVTNTGTIPIKIKRDEIIGSDEFHLSILYTYPFILQPSGVYYSEIFFRPKEPGIKKAELTIITESIDSVNSIQLSGEAVNFDLGPWDWKFIGRPLGDRDLSSIVIDKEDDNIWYVTSTSGLYITRDGGETWTKHLSESFIHCEAFVTDPIKKSQAYVGVMNNLFVTSDKGANWRLLHSFPEGAAIVSLTISEKDGTIFVPYRIGEDLNFSNPGIYISSDTGVNWRFESFGINYNHIIPWDIELDNANNIIYVCTEIGNHPQPYEPPILRSVDNGKTWHDISGIIPWHGLKIQIQPKTKDLFILTEGAGLFKSTDHGDTWIYLNNYFSHALYVDNFNTNIIFGGNHTHGLEGYGGVYASFDGGENFDMAGLSNLIIASLQMNNNHTKLYAVSFGAGLFVTDVQTNSTSVEMAETDIPLEYRLEQNYPNPCNPSTIIKYSVAHSGIVLIRVYDVLGKEVKTLSNEFKYAGAYENELDTRNLTSGIYFYSISSGGYSETKKMIILK